jgi:imidazolonepropionase-like amidohydrolase
MRSKWCTPDEILAQVMLLVEGNPLEHIELLRHPATNFVLIMKDGVIYKNTI